MAKKKEVEVLPIIPRDFASIDFETQYSSRASVCSVGIVKYIDGQPVAEYYSLVQPPWDIIPEWSVCNAYIHGIYDRDLIDQRYWPEVILEMEEFCGDLPLCAHNAAFEKSCFKACNEHYGIETSIRYEDIWDTLALTKCVEPMFGISLKGRGTRTLNTLCLMYGCPMEGTHHNALDDSYACGNLLKLFGEYSSMSVAERACIRITVPEPIIESHPPLGTVGIEAVLENI